MGESYGGKYVPVYTVKMLESPILIKYNLNIVGAGVADGFTNPF